MHESSHVGPWQCQTNTHRCLTYVTSGRKVVSSVLPTNHQSARRRWQWPQAPTWGWSCPHQDLHLGPCLRLCPECGCPPQWAEGEDTEDKQWDTSLKNSRACDPGEVGSLPLGKGWRQQLEHRSAQRRHAQAGALACITCKAGLGVLFAQVGGLKLWEVNYLSPSLSEPKALSLSKTSLALRKGSSEERFSR